MVPALIRDRQPKPLRYIITNGLNCEFNHRVAPATGVVKAINFEPGASIAIDATILVIGK